MALRILLGRVRSSGVIVQHLKSRIGFLSSISNNTHTQNALWTLISRHQSSATPVIGANKGPVIDFEETFDSEHVTIDGAENDDHIKNLARFAIKTCNERENARLGFARVLDAFRDCSDYFITLEAINVEGEIKIYYAFVATRLGENYMVLEGWKLADPE